MLMATGPTKPSTARVILFLGAPGSGKGTQSSWLSQQLGVSCLSTGEILRSEAKRNTPAGYRLRQVLCSGSLVSDEMVCAAVGARLRRDAAGVILDGFPRTLPQAVFLDDLLVERGWPRPTVIHLHVPRHELLRRMTLRRQCAVCGAIYNLVSRPSLRGSRCEKDGGALVQRDDDPEATALRRIGEFEALSAPLIEYYRGSDYRRVDGSRDPDLVAADLLEIVTREEVCAPAFA
jgi:adenylate kinase